MVPTIISHVYLFLSLFRMGFFRAAQGRGGGDQRPPSLKSVTHIIKWWNLAASYLTQRRSKKYMNHVTHLLSSVDISIFSAEISKFCYIKKYRYRLYFDKWFLFILTFLESLQIVIINMVKVLMMSEKMATPALLKIKVFWNKGYYVIFCLWRHKQNFVTWLKSYYGCSHMNKVW